MTQVTRRAVPRLPARRVCSPEKMPPRFSCQDSGAGSTRSRPVSTIVAPKNQSVGSATTSADEVDILTFDELVDQLAASSLPYTYHSGNLTIENGMIGIFIVAGDANFSRFVGRATVIARGNINFGGDSQITAVLQSESQFPGGLALFGRDVSVHGSVSGTIVATNNLNLAALR